MLFGHFNQILYCVGFIGYIRQTKTIIEVVSVIKYR